MQYKYLSTSQAAKLCNVTRHTIINWVNNGRIPSNKTIGGHRRIQREDLLKFISDNRIVTIGKEFNKYLIPKCWEFRRFMKSSGHNCAKCLVFQEKADKCFLLVKKFGSAMIQCKNDCLSCDFLMRYYPREWETIKHEVLSGVDKSVKKKGVLTPPCWRFKGFVNSDKHDCMNCIVFKRKTDRCFLAVNEFGSERKRCKHDCSACEYLRRHYSEERKALLRITPSKK